MKPALFISVILTLTVAVSVVLLVWSQQGIPDKATPATTTPGALAKATLATSELPALYDTANPEEDATQIYLDAIELAKRNRFELQKNVPDAEVVSEISALMIQGMNAGKVKKGFLDEKVSLKMGQAHDLASFTRLAGRAALDHAEQVRDDDKAIEICKAVFAYGLRVFDNNVIFELRASGRGTFKGAVSTLTQLNILKEDDPYWDRIDAWGEAEGPYERSINIMYKVVRTGGDVNIGDLTNVALYHGDPSFRIMALQRLSEEKYDPRNPANLKKINNAIAQAKNDPDPMVAKAANAAEALTVEEMHAAPTQ